MPHASTAAPVPDSKLPPSNKVPNACTKDIHATNGNGWTVGKLYKAAVDAAPDVIDRASPWDETLNCAYETQLKYCGSNRLPSYS
jgi:hypothetical protein